MATTVLALKEEFSRNRDKNALGTVQGLNPITVGQRRAVSGSSTLQS